MYTLKSKSLEVYKLNFSSGCVCYSELRGYLFYFLYFSSYGLVE